MLTLLLLFDEAHAIRVVLDGEDQKRLDFLNKSLSSSKYEANKETYLIWVKFFEEGEGMNSQYQVEAITGYCISSFRVHPRMESTKYVSHSPSYCPRVRGWLWHLCTWVLCTQGSTNAREIFTSQLVDMTLSHKLMRLPFMAEVQGTVS